MTVLLRQILILAFTTLVIVAVAVLFIVGMISEVGDFREKWPRLDKFLGNRATIAALLLVAIFLQIELASEVIDKEVPPIPPAPVVRVTAPPPPPIEAPPVAPHWTDATFGVEQSKPPAPAHLKLFVYSFYNTMDPPVLLRVTCTRVTGISNVHVWVGNQDVLNPKWTLSGKTIEIQFDGPALNTVNMLEADIYDAPEGFKILKVENWVR